MEHRAQDTQPVRVGVVSAEEWRRVALRVPTDWLVRPTRWILLVVVGLHALGALADLLGDQAPGFLSVLPWQGDLFLPVTDPQSRAAGAAVITALVLVALVHPMLGRLLPWVGWLLFGAMAAVTVWSGTSSAPLWVAGWLVLCAVCLLAAVPVVQRTLALRRWTERAADWAFVDSAALAAHQGSRGRRVPLVTGLALVGACVLWNGVARLLTDGTDWPPSLFGDLVPWGLGVLGLALVGVDVVREVVRAIVRHGVGPLLIEFPPLVPGPLASRIGSRWLPVPLLRDLDGCTCLTEHRRRNPDSDADPPSSIRPARSCVLHGHRRVNELAPEDFLDLARQGWLWDEGAGVWAEDLADFRNHPGRVLGFGLEGLGGSRRHASLTEEHHPYDIGFVERARHSLLRRHPPSPPARPSLREASRGEVIDTIDLDPIGIRGVAVRTTGEYPTFVPHDHPADHPAR